MLNVNLELTWEVIYQDFKIKVRSIVVYELNNSNREAF